MRSTQPKTRSEISGWARLPGLLLLALLTVPTQAWAFCRSTTCRGSSCQLDANGCPADGHKVFWSTACIGYSLQRDLTQNLDPTDTREAITKAFSAWSDLSCGQGRASITFSPQDDVQCRKQEYRGGGPNVNVVIFQDDDWLYRDTDNTLAKTTLTFDADTGEIFDADIEVNTSANKVTVGTTNAKYDLQSILTHEVGHLLGLAHSPKSSATMFASYEPGTTSLRSLDPDDIDAICAVYPPGRDAVCDPTPRGGQANACDVRVVQPGQGGCHATPTPSLWLLCVLLFAACGAAKPTPSVKRASTAKTDI